MDPRAAVMRDMVDNITLRNEIRSLLIKVRFENGAASYNHNESK